MAIILAKTYTNNVPDAPGRWRIGEVVTAVEDDHTFAPNEEASAGHFYHIKVTDKVKSEVESFLESWGHQTATVTQIAAVGDDRTIRIETTMVSASGDGAFSDPDNKGDGTTTFGDPAPGFATFLSDINAEFPTANATYNDHTWTTYDFDITAPEAAKDEIIERALRTVRDVQVHRARWYIPAASRTILDGQGNYIEGPAATVQNHLRDGLLD